MRISFDVDDTIVPRDGLPAIRPSPRFWRIWYPEPMRPEAPALMRTLIGRGCEIWIYTTSYRSPGYLRGWFRRFGVRVDGVVNQTRHERVVGRQGPSKFPPAFGIDLHVDDSDGVGREGERHGFAVVVVAPEDPSWADRVLEAVDSRSPRETGRAG